MAIEEIPVIRIELERMKFTLMNAVKTHLEGETDAIEQAIEKAFNEFDFAAEIERQTQQALKLIIGATVRETINTSVLDAEFFNYIHRWILREIAEATAPEEDPG